MQKGSSDMMIKGLEHLAYEVKAFGFFFYQEKKTEGEMTVGGGL